MFMNDYLSSEELANIVSNRVHSGQCTSFGLAIESVVAEYPYANKSEIGHVLGQIAQQRKRDQMKEAYEQVRGSGPRRLTREQHQRDAEQHEQEMLEGFSLTGNESELEGLNIGPLSTPILFLNYTLCTFSLIFL